MTRLLLTAASHADIGARIAAAAPDLEVLTMDETGAFRLGGTSVNLSEAPPEIVWADLHAFISPAVGTFFGAILQSRALKWVQSAAAGFDHPLFQQIVSKGAALTISHGQSVGIADYVLWGVLDHFQNGAGWRADQAARIWEPRGFKEINGTNWLIVGFGAIGQAVATRARAFGATITGVRRDQTPHPLADRLGALTDLHALAADADVVVLCIPGSAATRHIIDARFFAAMKPGAMLVNVGRGSLIAENDLLAALETGTPSHAHLDVFETEPLPADSPLWSHPNVTLTPHMAGMTGGQTLRNRELFLDNLGRYLDGRPLLNLADPKDVLAG